MYFELIKDLAGCEYYGDIPEVDADDPTKAETYVFGWEDMLLIVDDFSGPINALCGTLFDLGDVDWFDAEKCVTLRGWLRGRLGGDLAPRARELYTVLLDYANRAIDLGTGVVVDL